MGVVSQFKSGILTAKHPPYIKFLGMPVPLYIALSDCLWSARRPRRKFSFKKYICTCLWHDLGRFIRVTCVTYMYRPSMNIYIKKTL